MTPVEALVRSLDFQRDRGAILREVRDAAWPALLHVADEMRLTLPLAIRLGHHLPPEVRERLEREGAELIPGPPERLGTLIEGDLANWKKLIVDARLSFE